jgi:hypothetical protein
MDRVFGGPGRPSRARRRELFAGRATYARRRELDEVRGPDRSTLEKLAEVFEGCSTLLVPYSDESLNQAFWDLSSVAFFAVGHTSIEWACVSA